MKHYRIVRLAPVNYNASLFALYTQNPALHLQPYEEQLAALLRRQHIYGDSFSRAMRALGHDAHEIVYDVETLQKAWANENDVEYEPDNWQHPIIMRQIEALRPEVIYFQDVYSLPFQTRRELKQLFPFIRLVIVFRGHPAGTPEGVQQIFAGADVILVGSPVMYKKCVALGMKPQLVYHAFDETILRRVGEDSERVNEYPRHNFTFVGSSGAGRGLSHRNRYLALIELIQRTNLELWVDELEQEKPSSRAAIRMAAKKLIGRFDTTILHQLTNLPLPGKVTRLVREIIEDRARDRINDPNTTNEPLAHMYPRRCHPGVYGIEMYKVLQQSRVTFNKHSDEAAGTVDNMRLFQATGVGTCLLTDTGINMCDLFEDDREVVTYTSIDECVEKVHYLLEHEDVRRQIAKAGQKRTLRDHTVLHRCQQINEILQKAL